MQVAQLDAVVRQYVQQTGTAAWGQAQMALDKLQGQSGLLISACVGWLDSVVVADEASNQCAFIVLQVSMHAKLRVRH